MDVGRRELTRPDDPRVVVVALDDAGDGARDTDAVGPHDDGRQLAVLVEDPQVERLRILLAELEDVSHLDATRTLEDVVAVRAGVTEAHLGRLDRPVAREVTPDDEVDDVAAGLVRAGHPPRAFGDPGIEQVADAGRALGAQRAGPDVPLGEPGVLGERLLVEGLDLGRLDLGTEPLLVDLAVAGHADGQRLTRAIGVHEQDDSIVLELRDNGVGFDTDAPGPEGHFGMAMMRERAQVGGGTFELKSAPNEGTTITVRFPSSLLQGEAPPQPVTGGVGGGPGEGASPGTSGTTPEGDGSRRSVHA